MPLERSGAMLVHPVAQKLHKLHSGIGENALHQVDLQAVLLMQG